MNFDLPTVWAGIIAFGVMMYVVMDGFDLGVGILFPFIASDDERDVMTNTIAPVWDGNETWMVLGGAALMAAFPLAYSALLTAFYLPLILMLVGLIFRGVALEFRFKAVRGGKRLWDKAFSGGSYIATLAQGVTLGAYIQGVPTANGEYVGGDWIWIGLFPALTGIGLLVAYAMLGSTWLIMRTVGPLQARMVALASRLGWVLFVFIGAISAWTPFTSPRIQHLWFDSTHFLWLAPVPALVLIAMLLLQHALRSGAQTLPFVSTLALIFLGYSGLCISLWPYIVPPSLSITQAASPDSSMRFALVGTLAVIPLILAYTATGYWIFRHKVRVGEAYH